MGGERRDPAGADPSRHRLRAGVRRRPSASGRLTRQGRHAREQSERPRLCGCGTDDPCFGQPGAPSGVLDRNELTKPLRWAEHPAPPVLRGDRHMNWLRSFGNGRVLFRLLTAFTLGTAVALGLYACKNSTDEEGVVAIGLTDTPGDFLTYTVDVTSLTLTKADNTTDVQTLPQRTRVDFARYVDLTEFVTAVTIPAGSYVSATLNLDYNNADIQVEDSNGAPVPVPPANIHDSKGAQVTTLSMIVKREPPR